MTTCRTWTFYAHRLPDWLGMATSLVALGMALAVPPGVASVVDVLLAVPLGVAAAVDVVQLNRMSASLLGQLEVDEDMLVPHRIVVLPPLHHVNSFHHVLLEDKAVAQLLVVLMMHSMLVSRILAHLHGA